MRISEEKKNVPSLAGCSAEKYSTSFISAAYDQLRLLFLQLGAHSCHRRTLIRAIEKLICLIVFWFSLLGLFLAFPVYFRERNKKQKKLKKKFLF